MVKRLAPRAVAYRDPDSRPGVDVYSNPGRYWHANAFAERHTGRFADCARCNPDSDFYQDAVTSVSYCDAAGLEPNASTGAGSVWVL